MSLSVNSFLEEVDPDVLKTLLDYAIPINKFEGVEVPDLLKWRFCDVVDMSEKDVLTTTIDLLKQYGNIDDDKIKNGSAKDFVSLCRFVRLEAEKASKLLEQLRSDPDPDMINAGVDKMDRFGVVTIYYGISKNPLDWDSISEIPFGKMYTKLMLDKVSGEIQNAYSKVISDKHKR